MKKMKLKQSRLPRQAKILRNLMIFAALLLLAYLLIGAPPLSEEALFRRIERQYIIGPAQILAIIDVQDINWWAPHHNYHRLVVAKSNYGITLMRILPRSSSPNVRLFYTERTGNVTLAFVPVSSWIRDFHFDNEDLITSIIAIDNVPNAVRAELTLTLHNEFWDFEREYTVTSEREYDGFFLFAIFHPVDEYTIDQLHFLAELGRVWRSRMHSFPATIRLFDAAGTLIYEQEMLFN